MDELTSGLERDSEQSPEIDFRPSQFICTFESCRVEGIKSAKTSSSLTKMIPNIRGPKYAAYCKASEISFAICGSCLGGSTG